MTKRIILTIFVVIAVISAGVFTFKQKPIAPRPSYSKLFTPTSRKDKVNALANELKKKKNGIYDRMAFRNEDKSDGWPADSKPEGKFYETDKLPLQLLIAGKKDGKCGCLVFMVGTEILEGAEQNGEDREPFREHGFYTELPEVVDMYKDVAKALIQHATNKRYDKSWRTWPKE